MYVQLYTTVFQSRMFIFQFENFKFNSFPMNIQTVQNCKNYVYIFLKQIFIY